MEKPSDFEAKILIHRKHVDALERLREFLQHVAAIDLRPICGEVPTAVSLDVDFGAAGVCEVHGETTVDLADLAGEHLPDFEDVIETAQKLLDDNEKLWSLLR